MQRYTRSQMYLMINRILCVLIVSSKSLLSTVFPNAVEELCAELARAIEAGDTQAAVQHATSLAHQQMALTIQPAPKDSEDGEIR